jgi:hypothetical protein
MSVSGIINPSTNQIYDELIPQGGGVSLVKGQIITALNGGKEVAFPTSPPINGSVLSYNSGELTGLKYIPSANIEIDYQELLSSTSANVPTVIPPPAQNGYILTANTNPSNPTGLAWEPVGGTGKITATLPLVEEAVNGASNLYINFTGNVVGQIPYGNGTAKTGNLTNVPTAGQILGIYQGNPTWIPAGGSGTITALYPLTEYADGTSSKVAVDFVAKGDLISGGGVQVGGNPISGVILSLGANDTVLTANSNTPSGLEWKASGSGSSAIIYRNSQTNTPLIIQKPTTANDTMVLTSDRVYTDINSQIYSTGFTGGIQQNTSVSFAFYYWTPTFTFTLTNITADIKLYSSNIQGTSMAIALCANNDPTTVYSTSDPTNVGTAGAYNFSNFDSLPFQIIANTTYTFYVLITLAPTDIYSWFYQDPQDPLNSKMGQLGVVGINYVPSSSATFTFPTGKFRISDLNYLTGFNNALLESYTSQSYVSSGDTNDWIQIGDQKQTLAYQ